MLLYIVSESDGDAAFYAACVSKLTGLEIDHFPLKNRKADGAEAVKKQLFNALQITRATAASAQPVGFLAAIDNDRSPHPENSALNRARLFPNERDSVNRLGWMNETLTAVFKENPAKWPLPVALAVPVEMLESWIVLAQSGAAPQPQPYFSRATSASARAYYAPSQPPPQWKDIVDSLRGERTAQEFFLTVLDSMDAVALAARSLSFRMFKEWLDQWPKPEATE